MGGRGLSKNRWEGATRCARIGKLSTILNCWVLKLQPIYGRYYYYKVQSPDVYSCLSLARLLAHRLYRSSRASCGCGMRKLGQVAPRRSYQAHPAGRSRKVEAARKLGRKATPPAPSFVTTAASSPRRYPKGTSRLLSNRSALVDCTRLVSSHLAYD